jgi:hypothetical protein
VNYWFCRIKSDVIYYYYIKYFWTWILPFYVKLFLLYSQSCRLCLTVVYWLLECNKVPSWIEPEYATIYIYMYIYIYIYIYIHTHTHTHTHRVSLLNNVIASLCIAFKRVRAFLKVNRLFQTPYFYHNRANWKMSFSKDSVL